MPELAALPDLEKERVFLAASDFLPAHQKWNTHRIPAEASELRS